VVIFWSREYNTVIIVIIVIFICVIRLAVGCGQRSGDGW
jgi:hypothetical protein